MINSYIAVSAVTRAEAEWDIATNLLRELQLSAPETWEINGSFCGGMEMFCIILIFAGAHKIPGTVYEHFHYTDSEG